MNATPAKKTKKSTRKGKNDNLFNILTIVFVLMTLCLCGLFYTIFTNPYTAINPFPPNTPIPPTISPTITPLQPPATWTPEPTTIPTRTNTPRPTLTIEPTSTPLVLVTPDTPTITPSPTRTVRPTGVPYGRTIRLLDSTTFRPETTCGNFLLAGQVLDARSNHVVGLMVRMGGSLPGKSFNPSLTTLSGIVPAYGPSGFEFDLGIQPVASRETLWIQLFNQEGGALSEQIFLTTSGDCDKNLIFIQFKQR
jgi:hypothetical protein